MYLTYWQCKYIRKCPGAVEHQVKLRSTRHTEEACHCGAKLPPHLILHVPQCSDNTHSQGSSDCTEHTERTRTFKEETLWADWKVPVSEIFTYQLCVEFGCIQQRGQKHSRGAEHREEQGAEERPWHHAGELMMVILKDNTGSVSTIPTQLNLNT